MQMAFLLIAYLAGAIPFGLITGRIFFGADVRKKGSGNIGATNVARTMGKKWGIVVLLLDAFKGFIVVDIGFHLGDIYFCNLVAASAVIGHCYPVYLKFKGGKGVATALGVLLALSPLAAGLGLIIFVIVAAATRIVSAASLSTAFAAALLATIIQGQLLVPTAWFLAIIIWWKHRANLQRLLRREEPKFF